MIRRHEVVTLLLGGYFIEKRLLVAIKPCSHARVQKRCDAHQSDRRLVHIFVIDGRSSIPVSQSQSIRCVENDHIQKCNWEKYWKARCKQECHPSIHEQDRVLLIDLKLPARIEFHVSKKSLLARLLWRKFSTASSLVERSKSEPERPLADKLCWREESLN